MVLSSLYYLATAEVMSYNTNVYNIFPSRYKHEVISILLIIISFLLTFIRKRLVYSYIFLCILCIIVLVYISVIVGISYNSYTNTDSFKAYAGRVYKCVLEYDILYVLRMYVCSIYTVYCPEYEYIYTVIQSYTVLYILYYIYLPYTYSSYRYVNYSDQ